MANVFTVKVRQVLGKLYGVDIICESTVDCGSGELSEKEANEIGAIADAIKSVREDFLKIDAAVPFRKTGE